MKRLDEETWAEIRSAYETTQESVRSIAARYGTSESTMYTRIVREQWALRSKGQRVVAAPVSVRARRTAPAPEIASRQSAGTDSAENEAEAAELFPPVSVPLSPREPDTPARRAQRLLRLIDLQLDHMERYMSTGGPETAQDQERNARAFSTIVGELDNVMGTITGLEKGPEAEGTAGDDRKRETERLRREVAERLERLNQQWLAQSKSE